MDWVVSRISGGVVWNCGVGSLKVVVSKIRFAVVEGTKGMVVSGAGEVTGSGVATVIPFSVVEISSVGLFKMPISM